MKLILRNYFWSLSLDEDSNKYSIGKSRPNSKIKPRMYVRYSIMHFVSRNWPKEN